MQSTPPVKKSQAASHPHRRALLHPSWRVQQPSQKNDAFCEMCKLTLSPACSFKACRPAANCVICDSNSLHGAHCPSGNSEQRSFVWLCQAWRERGRKRTERLALCWDSGEDLWQQAYLHAHLPGPPTCSQTRLLRHWSADL